MVMKMKSNSAFEVTEDDIDDVNNNYDDDGDGDNSDNIVLIPQRRAILHLKSQKRKIKDKNKTQVKMFTNMSSKYQHKEILSKYPKFQSKTS